MVNAERDAAPASFVGAAVKLEVSGATIEFTPEEVRVFRLLLSMADVDGDGVVAGDEGAAFLKRSGLEDATLKSIWGIASGDTPSLTLEAWFVASKLVSAVQHGHPCTPQALAAAGLTLPLPDFALGTAGSASPCACGSCGESGESELTVHIETHDTAGSGYTSHTVYRLRTHTTMRRFAHRDVAVWRRYSDFAWLHSCFNRIGGVLLPPLPEKRLVGTQRASFVAERTKWLERYICRISRHPVLRQSYELQIFLEGSAPGLAAAKQLLPWSEAVGLDGHGSPSEAAAAAGELGVGGGHSDSPSRRSSGGSSTASNSGGSGNVPFSPARSSASAGTPPTADRDLTAVEMISVPAHTWSSTARGYAGALWGGMKTVVGLSKATAPVAVEQDAAYEAAAARLVAYEPLLGHAADVAERVTGLKRGQAYELSRLGHYLQQVATLEGSGGGTGGGGSSGSGQEVRMLVGVGNRAESIAMKWQDSIDDEVCDFVDVLKEHRGYIGMAQAVMQQRGDAIAELQDANGSLQRNKQRLQAARASGAHCKAEEAQAKMAAAEGRMEEARGRMLAVANNFKGEALRYEREKAAEMHDALLHFVRQQAAQARAASAAWKKVLEDINPTDAEMQASQRRVRANGGAAAVPEGADAVTGRAGGGGWTAGGGDGGGSGWGSSAGASAEEGDWDGVVGKLNLGSGHSGGGSGYGGVPAGATWDLQVVGVPANGVVAATANGYVPGDRDNGGYLPTTSVFLPVAAANGFGGGGILGEMMERDVSGDDDNGGGSERGGSRSGSNVGGRMLDSVSLIDVYSN